jgi:5-methyltetrahydrofolate--homocysteine methyltransferase
MSNRFLDLLANRPFLMLDGATGTNLFQMGLMTGDAPELWNFEQPEKIAALHQSFVDAGSDVFLTNSFGGTRYRLKLHNAQDRVHEINREAARIARKVADKAGRPVIVAGSMGPTGELYEPLGPLTIADGADAFAEQARALAEGGVDVLWIETMSSREEVAAAVKGAAVTGLPFVTTCSFDTNGRTMMGLTPAEFARFVHELDPKPAAYGANCGVGAPDLVLTVTQLAQAAAPGDIIIAKGNCGIPYYDEGQIRYNGTPALMADYARLVRDAGARLVGGCCGTSPEHLAAIRGALDSHQPGTPPSVETIVDKLGPLTSALAANLNAEGPTAQGGAGEGRRGRRRSAGSQPSF